MHRWHGCTWKTGVCAGAPGIFGGGIGVGLWLRKPDFHTGFIDFRRKNFQTAYEEKFGVYQTLYIRKRWHMGQKFPARDHKKKPRLNVWPKKNAKQWSVERGVSHLMGIGKTNEALELHQAVWEADNGNRSKIHTKLTTQWKTHHRLILTI